MGLRRCPECGRAFSAHERMDRAQVRAEYGLSRVDTDRMFERLPITSLPEGRRVYVTRSDVEAYLDAHRYAPGERVRRIA